MFLFVLFSLISSESKIIPPGENLSLQFPRRGVFLIYNPEEFIGYVGTQEITTKSTQIFGNSTYHAVMFTDRGVISVINPSDENQTLIYLALSYGTLCETLDIYLDPSIGHYFQVGYSGDGNAANVSLTSYSQFCLFYLGPSNYTIKIYSSVSRYYAALYINNDYSTYGNLYLESHVFIHFQSEYIRNRASYVNVEFTDEEQWDVDYNRTERKLTMNDIYCFGSGECSMLSISEYDEKMGTLSPFSLAIIGSVCFIAIIFALWMCYCCGCFRHCCCKCCIKTTTGTERTALIDDDEACSPTEQNSEAVPPEQEGPIYGAPPPETPIPQNDGPTYYRPDISRSRSFTASRESPLLEEEPQQSVYIDKPDTNPYE